MLATAEQHVYRAVADPTRRAMLDLLHRSDRAASDFLGAFRISQPAVSQHLRVLRRAGLVRVRRDGRRRVYRLRPAPITRVYRWAAKYARFADPSGHLWGLAQPADLRRNLAGPAGKRKGD